MEYKLYTVKWLDEWLRLFVASKSSWAYWHSLEAAWAEVVVEGFFMMDFLAEADLGIDPSVEPLEVVVPVDTPAVPEKGTIELGSTVR